MRAKIDSALSLVNCAIGYAAATTCTAYQLMKITFAGMLTSSFLLQYRSPGPLAKNTHVAPYVQLPEYAKSIQLHTPSKLRSLEGTRRFSIPR
jgi:hypothetical protein